MLRHSPTSGTFGLPRSGPGFQRIEGCRILRRKRTSRGRSDYQVARSKHTDRRRYLLVIERYLADCYEKRTAARASELAQFLSADRTHLSRTIVELFGKSLHTILREKQFDEARRLLRLTPLSMDEVATASGFGHRSTFFRLFRDAFGTTPSEYRKKATKCDFTKE